MAAESICWQFRQQASSLWRYMWRLLLRLYFWRSNIPLAPGDAEDEIAGLDVSEHGLLTAYAGFAMQPDIAAEGEAVPAAVTGDVPAAEAIPVKSAVF